MRYKDVHRDLIEDMDKVFKEMDKVFKQMEKQVEEAMESVQAQATPEPWEKWFAWHPVTIKNKRQWFKNVYRRTKLKYGDQRLYHEWEYADIFDVIKEASK